MASLWSGTKVGRKKTVPTTLRGKIEALKVFLLPTCADPCELYGYMVELNEVLRILDEHEKLETLSRLGVKDGFSD